MFILLLAALITLSLSRVLASSSRLQNLGGNGAKSYMLRNLRDTGVDPGTVMISSKLISSQPYLSYYFIF